jgi:ElaB/YqjD/DUF883 family membrane-anchored ribosome-binding protein
VDRARAQRKRLTYDLFEANGCKYKDFLEDMKYDARATGRKSCLPSAFQGSVMKPCTDQQDIQQFLVMKNHLPKFLQHKLKGKTADEAYLCIKDHFEGNDVIHVEKAKLDFTDAGLDLQNMDDYEQGIMVAQESLSGTKYAGLVTDAADQLMEEKKQLMEEKKQLMEEKKQLRKKEEQLMEEKKQLRKKEEQLMEEKKQLRKKEEQLRQRARASKAADYSVAERPKSRYCLPSSSRNSYGY